MVTFGMSSVAMHLGVFINDLHNIVPIVLRLFFYLSGIFFSIINRVSAPWGPLLLNLNPIAFLINESRNALLYNQPPNLLISLIWFLVGLGFTVIGISAIHKYENTYVKVIK